MDNNDKKRFAQIMTGLADDCSAKLSSHGLALKFEAMKHHSIEEIEAAVITVMKTNIYTKMPTTGTILNAITGTIDDRAELQYNIVLRAIREVGSYGTPIFKDRATQSIVFDRFGWSKICRMDHSQMGFFENEFKRAYTTQSKPSYEAMRLTFEGRGIDANKLIKDISKKLS